MGRDFYKILGVSRDADDVAIKKAYKKAAIRWHPDKNKDNIKEAEEKFKEISLAYEVLSDKNKRAVFDQYGEEGLNGVPADSDGPSGGFSGFPGGGGGVRFTSFSGGMRPEDIFAQVFGGARSPFDVHNDPDLDGMGGMGGMGGFSSMFGGFPGMGGMGGMGGSGQRGNRQRQGHAITRSLPVSLEDLYSGVKKKLKITRQLFDPSGKSMPAEKIVEVDVKPGWKAGTKVTFEKHGDEIPGQTPSDIVFVIEEKPHHTFKRDGNNIIMRKEIPLKDALCGMSFDVVTLGNKKLRITTTDTVISPGYRKVISGHGMPISKQPNTKGDLIVEFDVKFPTRLTAAQQSELSKIL